ncbi:ATP-NAD kinase-like domain-containing protein [Artemisia annua]|uniref:ATP-NAD kinase-like domain-containing protein n=1 Tax=Artemisia annua TaxID=35608 RepID=A0A2U1KK52_ARTAN|nr:ATP-NAD kinase-like domain-containing protein [Artemisia annua]
MASHPILTVLEQSQVSPPPATVTNRSLPLTFLDFFWLREPPVHYVFFYEFPLTKTQFVETIVPSLKHSLSITLQHFFPLVGKLVLFPSPKKPEIRYVEGDSVTVTFAECNLDFDDLTGNHQRECDKFYNLIPQLGKPDKTLDHIKIPVFAVQMTFFTNRGFSIGMTNHHTLGDASTRFIFLKAWTSIAKSGNDESFLANGTLPSYERLVENTKLGESYLKFVKYDTITENYELKTLSGPTDKVRATFILTRNVLNQLKKTVLTELPTIAYASSFTVACAYVWNCLATSHDDERQLFGFTIDCRARVDPPVPANYFGNCLSGCYAMEKTAMLTGKEGFVNAAKLLGNSLHNTLTNKKVLEQSQVSPPPATVTDRSLPLTFLDFFWLREPPVHYVFFYEFPLTKTEFVETIVPSLKHSLSITLQHFFPFVGKLVLFPSPKKPEIRYVEGDSITVTFVECNLDFDDLTGNHPRECDKFYNLIPQLGKPDKTLDHIKIPVFAVQMTFFPNRGFSIGMTNHHTLGDASTRFIFLKAWTSIAKSGNDESFLANGTLPSYERLVENTKLGESYLKFVKYDTITENYELKTLSGPTDKVRATFILTRNVLNQLKKTVLTELPTIAYASSFTVACAYVWNCLATSHDDERQLFGFTIDCRARVDPPVPANYFGNCLSGCYAMEKTAMLTGKEGFVNAAKLLGNSLHNTLTNKKGVMLDIETLGELFADGLPTSMVGVAGTPKLKSYDIDFGWGKPKKVETISLDFNGSISMNACRESSDDLEIGVVLPANEMDIFVRTFQDGLQSYI